MKLFVDASVLLAAAGSLHGSAHALFSYASAQGWTLVSSPYALNEVLRNLPNWHRAQQRNGCGCAHR